MQDNGNSGLPTPKRTPGECRETDWSQATATAEARRTRDLAMFNLAIHSKLRGCDASL
jgi:hypothetical protein